MATYLYEFVFLFIFPFLFFCRSLVLIPGGKLTAAA